MTVTKNEERGYWEVFFYYKDYTGKRKQKHKRGFKTKKEAVAWAERFMVQQSHNLDMTFQSFWELYRNDMSQRLRENTVRSKDYIVELKILPYFGEKKIADITAADIRHWQNSIMKHGRNRRADSVWRFLFVYGQLWGIEKGLFGTYGYSCGYSKRSSLFI